MRNIELSDRTKSFALRVIKLYGALPKRAECEVIGKQLLRSGTSVAANYREACRARTKAELVSKFHIVVQELDETQLWLELLTDAGFVKADRLQPLQKESDELLSIFVASIKTASR